LLAVAIPVLNKLIIFEGVSRLTTNIIAEFTEPNFILCVHHCAVHRFCVAINYKKKVEENKPNCQLTNTTKQKFDENASKKDKVWTFRKVDADKSLLVSVKKCIL
jgi:hypothetical protein